MEKAIKKRASNIELLRIIAMLMIIVHHIVAHCISTQLTDQGSIKRLGNGLFSTPAFFKKIYLLSAIYPLGLTGNAIFMLISGYFMVARGKNIDLLKISKKLLMQFFFSVAVLVLVSNVVFHLWGSLHYISMVSFMDYTDMSWYIGYYFSVIVLAVLFLNDFLLKRTKREYEIFLVIIFAVTQFLFTFSLLRGLSFYLSILAEGVFLYSFGGYIQKYDPFSRLHIFVFFLVIIAVFALIYVSYYNVTLTNIETFNRDQSDKPFVQAVVTHGNQSIMALLIAICLFEIFRRIKLPASKVINFLGASTLMVYLIHDNNFFYSLWNMKDWITDLHDSPLMFLLDLAKWGGATFMAGVLTYVAYLLFGKLLNKSKSIFLKKS